MLYFFMEIALLILAAGASSRMKACKQLLAFNDATLLETAVYNALQSKANQVHCVLGASANKIRQQLNLDAVNVINNQHWKEGLSSSIVAGLEHLNTKDLDAVLIMLADQPFVDTEYLNRLIDGFKNFSDSIIASRYGNNLGVPAVFPKQYFDKLLILKGDKGAKELLNMKSISVKSITSGNLVDIDTPEDYKALIDQKNTS